MQTSELYLAKVERIQSVSLELQLLAEESAPCIYSPTFPGSKILSTWLSTPFAQQGIWPAAGAARTLVRKGLWTMTASPSMTKKSTISCADGRNVISSSFWPLGFSAHGWTFPRRPHVGDELSDY